MLGPKFLSCRPLVRSLPHLSSVKKTIYLTFDDGPSPECTEDVLEILDRYQVKATFFLVAQRALSQKELTKKIIHAGHAIGNHSLDHSYRPFFKSKDFLRRWIMDSETLFREEVGCKSVGFRSPAGVITPPLLKVLDELHIPLIHWNCRFYDTVFLWSWERCCRKMGALKHGDIVLLHDTHQGMRKRVFLSTLDSFIHELLEKEFVLASLPQKLVFS